jgi:hypothetical protein
MRTRRAIAFAAATIWMLSCAGAASADNYTYRINRADVAAARAAVVKLSDLGSATGWTGGQQTPDRTEDDSFCRATTPKLSDLVVTGDAESRFQYRGGGIAVFTATHVYKTAAMVEESWRREMQDPDLACARKTFAAEVRKVGVLVSFERLAFPKTGTHTAAFRALVRYSNGASALTDLIAFARGRTICLLVMGGLVDTPNAPSILLSAEKRIAAMVAARMVV